MKAENKYYYQIHLEVSLKKPNTVFGFVNISNIPYIKFKEIFKNQIPTGREVFQDATGYILDQDTYKEHKEYLDKTISFTFNYKLFEYAVGLTQDDFKDYKKDYYEELPF